MPLLGPAALPPPQDYGTPICDPARLMTYSDASLPYTRGIAPLVKPLGVGRIPSFCRKLRPMSAVACAELDAMPRIVLMIAIGSPPTNALGIAGSVTSHSLFAPGLAGAAVAGARSQL